MINPINTVFMFGIGGFGNSITPTLPKEVLSKINYYILVGHKIIVGDCQGIDTLVQKYLNKCNYRNVVVYYSGSKCRNKVNQDWQSVSVLSNESGRAFYTAKDIAACNDADAGLAIWDGKSAGTNRNIKQLRDNGKSVLVYRLDKGYFEI